MNLLLQEYWQKPVLIWRRVNKWQSRQGQDVVVSAASGTTGLVFLVLFRIIIALTDLDANQSFKIV